MASSSKRDHVNRPKHNVRAVEKSDRGWQSLGLGLVVSGILTACAATGPDVPLSATIAAGVVACLMMFHGVEILVKETK